jgi:uncharacterized protein YkwD
MPFRFHVYLFLSVGFFIFFPAWEYSQTSDFSSEELFNSLLTGINAYRKEHGVDTLETHQILEKTAKKSAAAMAKIQKADPNAGGKTPGEKLKKEGGTLKADEVEFALVSSKGKKNISVKEMSQTILAKWKTEKRMKVALLQPNWVFCGFGEASDKDNKKHYVSCMLGGYESFNDGAKKKKELKVKYNHRSKKLKGPDAKTCKNCEAWKDLEKLQRGLKVEKGKIYIEYDNLKYLKKLIKKTTDGLAVDIVQYDQYKHTNYNILDNNQKNKGVMQKVVYRDKFFEGNLIKPDPKAKKKIKINKIKVQLGKLPSGISGPYELNLLVIQDKKICKTVLRSYLENGIQESNTPLTMLAPPEGISARSFPFEPKGETSLLNFVIPFEKNKSEFKTEDIQPFIDALNEPDFHIDGLYIYAYSSIEGDSASNAALQRKRAESITKVLHKINQTSTEPMIVTNDSWLLFQMEAEDGKFDYLAKMSKKQAIKEINKNSTLLEELEPILAKERFAQIVMDVTYDITGSKEERFAYMKFNQAVKQENFKLAYRILNFIFDNIKSGKYSQETWSKLEIPFTKKNSQLLVMRNYLDYLNNDTLPDEKIQEELKKIVGLDPENSFANYNSIFCSIKIDSTIGDDNYQSQLQNAINSLYKSQITKKETDALNTEWNFKVIDHYDTIEGMEGKVESCISKIKSFYNFKESNWENSLKLAYVFTHAGEYEFAANILEPHLKSTVASENLVFTYISIASHLPEKFYSRTFAGALLQAKDKNPERYCKLFGDPNLSFQVLDNPTIKKTFTESGCRW